MSATAVAALERGRNAPRLTTVRQIARALNLSPEELAALSAAVLADARRVAGSDLSNGPAGEGGPVRQVPSGGIGAAHAANLAELDRRPEVRLFPAGTLGHDEMNVGLGRGNLPAPLTQLVGRHQELAQAVARLETARLLTVVGTGGCGKTRLALAVGRAVEGQYPCGVWWVELAGLEEPGLVAQTVATTLGVPQTAGSGLVRSVSSYLAGQRLLLVLDNCENVAQECAELVAILLRSSPDLTVLATSRQPLVVPGEVLLRLGGLALQSIGSGERPSEAAELLLDRARSVSPSFAAQGQEAEIDRLCSLLDGLPLAIELAAARLNALSLHEIIDRLGSDERLLRHMGGSVPERHRTIRSTLDWSDQFLQAAGKALLRRLATFQGSFDLAAAEAVGACGEVARDDVVDVLCRLVDKSLVQAEDRGGERRYRLLGSVRRYYQQKLAESGEEEEAEVTHAGYYLELARQAMVGLEGPDQSRWLERVESELDNLRAALGRQLASGREAGGLLAGWLWPFWYRRGYYPEARRWLEMALTKAEGMSEEAQAAVLTGSGTLAFLQCEYEVAKDRLEQALVLQRELGNQKGVASILLRLGSIAREQARFEASRSLNQASLDIYNDLHDRDGVASCLDYLSFAAWLSGELVEACQLAAAALAHWRSGGRKQETAAALINLAAATHYLGQDEEAAQMLEEALAISREIAYQEGIAWASNVLALTRQAAESRVALAELGEALRIHFELGDRWRVASVLEALAIRIFPEEASVAARLMGAAATVRDWLGAPIPPIEEGHWADCVAGLRRVLGPEDYEQVHAAGAQAPLDKLVEEASRLVSEVIALPPAEDR